MFHGAFREPFMVQQDRPEVRAGDKRIILVDGVFAGGTNRVTAAGRDALQHARRRAAGAGHVDQARAVRLRGGGRGVEVGWLTCPPLNRSGRRGVS